MLIDKSSDALTMEPHPITCIIMHALLGHLDIQEDLRAISAAMVCLFTMCFCFSHAQEIAFRDAVLVEWHEQLDFTLRNVLPTVCRYHIANVTDLTVEMQKLQRWVSELTIVDSFFQR